MFPNFLGQIALLSGEFSKFLTGYFTDCSFDLMRKSEKFPIKKCAGTFL